MKGNEISLIDRVKSFRADVSANDFLHQKQKLMLCALVACRGIVSNAAAMAGISTDVHYHALKWGNQHYIDFYDRVDELVLDWVEDKLYDCIQEGNFGAIKFKLQSAKGRRRGYEADVQFNLPPVSFNINFGGNPDLQNRIEVPITPSTEVDDIGDQITAQTKHIDQSIAVDYTQLITTTKSIESSIEETIQPSITQPIEITQLINSSIDKTTHSSKTDTLESSIEI